MISRNEIKNYVEAELKIKLAHHVKYADRYDGPHHPFYIKSADAYPLVLHPDFQKLLAAEPIKGIRLVKLYHNAALTMFPRLSGQNKSPCGYDVEVANIQALKALLQRIGAITADQSDLYDSLAEIRAAEADFEALPETEREAIVLARLGQGRFRDQLMATWDACCAVTGIGIPALLRASHIKPWRLSDNRERLDPENGLLLVATLDAAFDAGLISFDDNGKMIFSSSLGSKPYDILGIKLGSALSRCPSRWQQAFLNHHRTASRLI